MKNKTKLPRLRTQNLVVKELPNELLIYDLERNKAFCLNQTARLIMDECDGITAIDEAVNSLNHKLKSKMSEDMIWMVLEQLKDANFIEKNYEIPIQTTRVTRRKILQSAATLGIALPIITSLIAPTAAHAQSGCTQSGGSCINNNAGSNCCQNLVCSATDLGPTGFQCLGCIPLGQTCSNEGTICCQGFCQFFGEAGFRCASSQIG